MALAANFPGDVQVAGTLTPNKLNVPPGAVTAGAISGGPGQYLLASNQQQQFQKEYKQPSTQTAAADRQVIHVVRGQTATLLDLVVGAVTANVGAATVTFDLKKNGTTVLTSTLVLTSATAAYAVISAAIATLACVTGDVFEIVVTVAAGGGTLALGVFARLALREDPA